MRLSCPAVLILVVGLPAQTEQWLRDLAGDDALAREVARRHLALAPELPTDSLTQLLASEVDAVVYAAATLLRDRGFAIDELRAKGSSASPAIRRALLPVATEAFVLATLEDASAAPGLRVAALYELEDRRVLSDEHLFLAMSSEVRDLADAACRLLVHEHSPFSLALADRVLEVPAAREMLLQLLARRPRGKAGPWLQRILGLDGLTSLDRVRAIHSLPPEMVDEKLAVELLRAAGSEDAGLRFEAGSAAYRLPERIADSLVPEFARLATPDSCEDLLMCLARVTRDGERDLLEFARGAPPEVRLSVFTWLHSRDSDLVEQFLAASLDSTAPFPPELVRLTVSSLDRPARIGRIAGLLRGEGEIAVAAFYALIEARVFHAAMLPFAMEPGIDHDRRLARLLDLGTSVLPTELFNILCESGAPDDQVQTLNLLSRGPLPKGLEPVIIEIAREATGIEVAVAACQVLILQGSEVGGRTAWQVLLSRGKSTEAILWSRQDPKPWHYEFLLQQREHILERMATTSRAEYHRVLIALAKLGDRGAQQSLVEEIPTIDPVELRESRDVLAQFCTDDDLLNLAQEYLLGHRVRVGSDLKIVLEIDDDRRAELVEWLIDRDVEGLDPVLAELWENDESYEVRLVALRGLLARESSGLYDQLVDHLDDPRRTDREQLAFEVVGSMSIPLSARAMELLAYLVLRWPLSEPGSEVRMAMEEGSGQGFDADLTGESRRFLPTIGTRDPTTRVAAIDYSLLTPVANLLRRDEAARPRQAFASVAEELGDLRYALNRRRLGQFLTGSHRRADLASELGPLLARLILESPDDRERYLGPAKLVLARDAEARGEFLAAAELFEAAQREFSREKVPSIIGRWFLDGADPVEGYHGLAALAARGPICRVRALAASGELDAARRMLVRASDLAEGDRASTEEITTLRRALQR